MNGRTRIFPLSCTRDQRSKFTGMGNLYESGLDLTAFERGIGQFPAKTGQPGDQNADGEAAFRG
jgi:hypothetical protein